MELTTLKKIRTLYPGLYSIVLALLYYWARTGISILKVFFSDEFSYDGGMVLPAVAILFIAVIYYAFNLRSIIWKPAMKKVGDNINKKLLEIAGIDTSIDLTNRQKESIKNSVFYRLIDNDESLKTKSLNVMHNGSILSCVADTILITPLFLLISILCRLCLKDSLTWSFYIGCILLVTAILIFRRLLKKHIALSNEQLSIIKDNYSMECKTEINRILNDGK